MKKTFKNPMLRISEAQDLDKHDFLAVFTDLAGFDKIIYSAYDFFGTDRS
jgi:hypothetical protein